MQRHPHVLQTVCLQMTLDDLAQRVLRRGPVAASHHGDQRGQRIGREHAAAQLMPQISERLRGLHALLSRRDERAVDGPGLRTDDQVSRHVALEQRLQHPRLDRAEARAARQDERASHPEVRGDGQSMLF